MEEVRRRAASVERCPLTLTEGGDDIAVLQATCTYSSDH